MSSSLSISCTAVLIPSPGHLKSHTFTNLVVSKAFIFKRPRSTFNSILIGSLLALLRHTVTMDDRRPDDIVDLILGEPRRSDIDIVTTCVPSFGDNIENPLHGYCILGPLMSVDVGMSPLPSPSVSIIDVDQELLSADPAHPLTQNVLKLWSQMGVLCETHFFIIFFNPPTTLPSSINQHTSFSLSDPRMIASNSFLRSQDSPTYQAPPLSHKNMDWEGLFSSGQAPLHSNPIISWEDSPASGVAASTTSHSHLSGSSGRPIGHLLCLPPPSNNHHDLFRQQFGVTNDTLVSAKYNGSEKSLLGMVLNHRSMLHLLNTFGLLENNIFVDAKTITLYDGQVLSSVDVIKNFDWSTILSNTSVHGMGGRRKPPSPLSGVGLFLVGFYFYLYIVDLICIFMATCQKTPRQLLRKTRSMKRGSLLNTSGGQVVH